MSVGPFSVGDVVDLCIFATKVYHAWSGAPKEYADITQSLNSLTVTLNRIEKTAKRDDSILDEEELATILRGSHEIVEELEAVVTENCNMGYWNRITFSVKDLEPLRTRLSHNLTSIDTYLGAVQVGSLNEIHVQGQDTNAVVKSIQMEIKSLKRSGTVMTKHPDDNARVWKVVRRKLIAKGIRSDSIEKYSGHIEQLMLYLSANEHQDVILDQAEDSMENSWHEPEPMDETDFPLETMHNEETLAPVLEASDSEPDSSDVEDEIERSWSSGSDPDLRRDDGQDLDEFYHEQSDEYNYEDQDEYAYEQRTELVHRQQETFSYQQQDAFIYQQRDDLVGHQQQEFVPSSGTSSSTINSDDYIHEQPDEFTYEEPYAQVETSCPKSGWRLPWIKKRTISGSR